MPPKSYTPLRNIRIDNELWNAALQTAKDENTTVSELIRELLTNHIKGPAK